MNTLCIECGENLKIEEEICSNCGTRNDLSSADTMTKVLDETIDSKAVSDQDETLASDVSPQSSARPPATEDELIGKSIGGAVIKKKIGKGGMGSVFLGHHLTLDIPVAIKFLRPEYAQRCPDAVERFLREARAVAKLRHPNIVSVYNAGFEEGFYFMSMEFIKGRDLSELLESPFNMSLKDALKLTSQVCDALDYAHNNKIVHRDIKPANIFIDEEGNAKVGDLGLAKDLEEDQSMTQSMQSMGTPYYISPEQATSARDVDHRSDIYSLGCTFYRLFCGKVPFKGNSSFATVHKHLSEPVPDPRNENPEIPPKVSEVIQRMMAKKPEERYQTMGEISKILKSVLDDVSDSKIGFAPKPGHVPKELSEKENSSNKGLYAVIALLAVLLMIVILKQGDSKAPNPETISPAENLSQVSEKDQYGLAKQNLEKGDYLAARKQFESYLKGHEDAIDAHLDLITVLKQSEGIEGAREYYRKWKEKSSNPSVHMAYLTLLRGNSKSEMQSAFEKQFPEYGPYPYYSSIEWKSEPEKQTFIEKQKELSYLEKFSELDSKGQFLKYFANRQNVENYRIDAKKRLEQLQLIKQQLEQPVSLKINFAPGPSNPSVIIGGNSTDRSLIDVGVYFLEPQNVQEFFYRIGEKGELKSHWKSSGPNDFPSFSIKVEDSDESIDIYVKYIDKKGLVNGPYKIVLNRNQSKIDAAKKTLNMIKSSWVSFRDYDNRLLFYFTTILSYSKGLKEIRYSIDNYKLDKIHQFDEHNPYDNVYIELPYETQKVFLQLTYKDDTKSEVIEFKKPAGLRKE